jgi:hypothetical protein
MFLSHNFPSAVIPAQVGIQTFASMPIGLTAPLGVLNSG